jgi:hypothetical protein
MHVLEGPWTGWMIYMIMRNHILVLPKLARSAHLGRSVSDKPESETKYS